MLMSASRPEPGRRCAWRRLPLAALLLAGLAMLGAACLPGAAPAGSVPPATPRDPLQLTLLHTNDTLGYLLPCG
jgi:hypothetical protein